MSASWMLAWRGQDVIAGPVAAGVVPWVISILRGLAFSATGIVSRRTPAS